MDRQRTLIRFLVAYAVILSFTYLILPRFFPGLLPQERKPPTPTQISQQIDALREQAAKAEAEAANPRLSLSDRAKKWDEALSAYRDLERAGRDSDIAIDAKFQQARIFEVRAQSDAKNTGDLEQAEQIYKGLERGHARKRATITVNGRPTEVVVGEQARGQLEAVLKERDVRMRGRFLYEFLDFFVGLTGRIPGFSYWFALLLITIIIKALLFPFTKRQFKSMADMQRLAPKMKEVQEKLKGRPADEIHRKTMELYKTEGINPAAGCVPMIAQMVVLIPLYNMIRQYEYQFREGYFAWIGSHLSQQYPQWLATSLALPDVPLLVLYCISMVLTSKLQPPASDPQQAQMQKMMTYFMPIIFGWFTWTYQWPAAFTFYWLVLNLISTAQQWHILKAVGSPAAPAPTGSAGRGGSSGSGPAGGGSGGSGPSTSDGSGGSNGSNGGRPGGRTVTPRSRGAKKTARR